MGEEPELKEDVLKVHVRSGAWHAYFYDIEAEDEGEALGGMLLLHADHCDVRVSDVQIDVGGVNLEWSHGWGARRRCPDRSHVWRR